MDTVKVNLAAMNENLKRNEDNVKAVMEHVVAKVELVQEQLNKQEEGNRRLEADNMEMKKSLNEMTKILERMAQQTSRDVRAEEMKKGIAEAGGMDRESKVVVAGGGNDRNLNSVGMFSLATGRWTPLQLMRERRQGASSVVHNNQMFVSGGFSGNSFWSKSIEKLSLKAVLVDQSIPWEVAHAELPGRLMGHCSVVYNGRLIVIGGFDPDKSVYSDSIIEISLTSPYTRRLLATMLHRRFYCGVALFGDKVLIVGGRQDTESSSALRNVVMYDMSTNEFQELAPFPYHVCEMATVKWGDDNVMIMGGIDTLDQTLKKVLMYNIKTQKSHMLPDMKYKRSGCVAAVVRDTVIVMGGEDQREKALKSVECFRFDSYTWKELADMHEARCWATAVLC